MALLIFPIAVLLGWYVRPPRRAAIVTAVVGGIAFVGMVVLIAAGTGASPLEALVLAVGTPISGWLAFAVARRRDSRHTQVSPAGE